MRKDTSRKAGPQLTLGAVLFPQKKTLFELRQYAIHIGVVIDIHIYLHIPSKIEWDLTNGPLGKLLKLLDAQV